MGEKINRSLADVVLSHHERIAGIVQITGAVALGLEYDKATEKFISALDRLSEVQDQVFGEYERQCEEAIAESEVRDLSLLAKGDPDCTCCGRKLTASDASLGERCRPCYTGVCSKCSPYEPA